MATVLDYSNWRPPSIQALKDAGVVGVVRYVAPSAWGWPKAITRDELNQLVQAGIAVGFNFEAGAGDWQGGYAAGVRNGTNARIAMDELGMGRDIPCHPSFDTYVAPSAFPTAAAYARGFQDALQHVPGAYGEGDLIEYLAANGLLAYGWQSESTSFPGNQAPTPHTVLRQVYGIHLPGLPGQYDANEIHQPDWGQFPRPEQPKPVPVPVTAGGITVGATKAATITLASKGLGVFEGIYDAKAPVAECQVSTHGPAPEADGWWDQTIEGQARCQARGNTVVVTGFYPRWRPGKPMPQVHVLAVLA